RLVRRAAEAAPGRRRRGERTRPAGRPPALPALGRPPDGGRQGRLVRAAAAGRGRPGGAAALPLTRARPGPQPDGAGRAAGTAWASGVGVPAAAMRVWFRPACLARYSAASAA